MNETVQWVLEVAIKQGELDNFKALMNEMVEATQANEPNTTNYEWFISDDDQTCHLYERYADSAATMTHLASFGENFADRFLAAVAPTRIVVYGNPSAEVREALAAFGAVHMAQIGGFAR
jgi:quinol monooxygenase YgiN